MLALLVLAYVWLCDGETTGCTNTDINRLFMERAPAREWRTYVFPEEDQSLQKGEKGDKVSEWERQRFGQGN
jgi:hypothetical protein